MALEKFESWLLLLLLVTRVNLIMSLNRLEALTRSIKIGADFLGAKVAAL